MKTKKVLLIGGSIATVLMLALVALVFTMPNVLAQKTVAMEEPLPEATATELPEEPITEEPTEMPEEPTDNAPEDAVLPEEPAEAPDAQEVAAEDPAETPAEPVEIPEGKLKIGCHPQSRKALEASEVVYGNWETTRPGAADLSRDQAIETAKYAAQAFGIKDMTITSADFHKDMTGQRGNYWFVTFKEDGMGICIDALNGAVTRAYSETRRSVKDREALEPSEFNKVMNQIVAEEEAENGGKYTAATRALAEHCIGNVKEYSLNAVHGDGTHYPLVSIDVVAEDGTVYEFEWATTGDDHKIVLCSLSSFLSWDHFWAWASWDADLMIMG